jgi:hypothetical protein
MAVIARAIAYLTHEYSHTSWIGYWGGWPIHWLWTTGNPPLITFSFWVMGEIRFIMTRYL